MSGSRRQVPGHAALGTGVICETCATKPPAVIPAKAGIYSANLRRRAVGGLDSSRHGGTGMTGVSKKKLTL